MKIQNLSKEEVFKSLVTSDRGLSEEDAGRRLHEYGLNEIKEVRKRPLYLRLISQFTHFLAILLWIAAFFSFLSEYLHPGEGMLTLGIAIIGVIFINAVFTFIQEYRAKKALEALKRLLPFYVKVLRDGKEKEIHGREVVPGDMIMLSEGDKIPADARLIKTSDLKVNNAPLTGESEPMLRNHEPFDGEFLESPNIAFAGTTVISGSGMAVAFATGMTTEFGRIAHLTSAVEAGLSPLQKEIIKATRIVATIAAVVGIFFFSLGFLIGRSFWENFIFAIGITVALIPEGMLPTMTLSLAMGSQRMAKRKALIKTLTSVETLGAVTVICTDKTGTLTQNKMAVTKMWTASDGFIIPPSPPLSKGGNNKSALLKGGERGLSSYEMLMHIAYLCNNARFIDGQYKGDPTEVALLKVARETIGYFEAERMQEIPFDSDRKRMTTINIIPPTPPLEKGGGGGFVVFTKGAMESVLPLCSHLLIDGEKVPIDETLRKKTMDAYHALMDMGLRVLSFAYKEIGDTPPPIPPPQGGRAREGVRPEEVENNMVFAGLIGLEDPPRPEVPEAIQKCNEAGIKIIMITGDGSRTAVAIAREIGLIKGNPALIEGHEFDQMSDEELRKKLLEKEVIFARMTPKHKMRVVSILKDEDEIVAVTGDGVNDAPALKKADIGIAMGISGTDVAKEASDMILLDDNFATIVNAVEEGRAVYENIKKFITYIFASNIPEAVPYLAYILLRIPLPLTIIQILAVDLGTDMLPALALGAEKPTPGLMKQPPRKLKERLLDLPLIIRSYLFLGPIEAIACMFGFFYVLYNGGWIWGTMLSVNNLLYLQATTACLTAIIITQIGNVFACRSSKESIFSIGFFTNRLIFAGIMVEILLQLFIVYHPFGNKIFRTAPLSLDLWLILIPFSIGLLAAEEVRKFYSRRL
ncbi:MAG: ATPase [Nitrospirae bacterium CG_4_10_14_0_8_um_filter_41_23]|nr:MAG: ATPase [Nitrospirae bacterium CG11_big_fil_rev_8_21_14_0_20_41_14]PIV41169.1 MAG: ATPase [Nitrospirae bacterium CG02_land_8_20_14_3_00_41_53]PIW88376.1 MAG: ATPase [Nitrospirae bacterium CG_4_8_14_3_um_filter_41_47]PIY87652.1 MAG: ATPase [Nitrospirae bacterium CG_4_10_14_0_8_um_filter_41_23]PJA80933.1 MAG: ATPase [Nitrospirae bacterium CG_4_9_14_3_um_filter_41_27]